MKAKSRKSFNTVGTATAAVVAVAAASTHCVLGGSNIFPATGLYDHPQNRKSVLFRVHRGGGDHESSDSSSHPHQPEPPEKKKKSRAKSSHVDPHKTKSKGRTSEEHAHKDDASKPTPTPIQSFIATEKDLYNILGLHQQPRSSITNTDIQKAYRRRCLLTHPDKVPNGDRAAFDKVTEAFNILSDENKRALYDKFGIDAVKDGGDGFSRSSSSSGMGEEILRQFFGGNPAMDGMRFFQSATRQQQQQAKPKNRNLRYQLEVSLEDMYMGSHQRVTIAQPSSSSKKVLEVTIPRGIAHGQKIHLPGEVDHIADCTPADVIFVVIQRKHTTFTRKGHDLAMEVTLCLSEALCGFERVIKHLDGREIHVRGPVLEGNLTPRMVQTGDVHVLKGEGMPKRYRGQNIPDHDFDEKERCHYYGDLYIQFKVDLPSTMSSSGGGGTKKPMEEHLNMEERSTLRNLLHKLQGTTPVENFDHVAQVKTLKTASPMDFGRASGSVQSTENEEEEEEDGKEDLFRRSFSSSGPGRSGFFSSSTASTDENGNVQCQQM